MNIDLEEVGASLAQKILEQKRNEKIEQERMAKERAKRKQQRPSRHTELADLREDFAKGHQPTFVRVEPASAFDKATMKVDAKDLSSRYTDIIEHMV